MQADAQKMEKIRRELSRKYPRRPVGWLHVNERGPNRKMRRAGITTY